MKKTINQTKATINYNFFNKTKVIEKNFVNGKAINECITMDTLKIDNGKKEVIHNHRYELEEKPILETLSDCLDKDKVNDFRKVITSIFFKQYARLKNNEIVFVHDSMTAKSDIDEIINQTYLVIVDNFNELDSLTAEKPLKMVLGLAVFKAVKELYKNYRDNMMIHTVIDSKVTYDDDGTKHIEVTYGYKPITSIDSFNSETLLFGDFNNTPEIEYILEETRIEREKKLEKALKDIDNLYPWFKEVAFRLASGETLKHIAVTNNVDYTNLRKQVSRARLTLNAIHNGNTQVDY